jgi:hypothetical protein
MHAAATSKVENSAQGSSCKLKFVHVGSFLFSVASPKVARASTVSVAVAVAGIMTLNFADGNTA